ncbi:PREDICTED: uncharacterized protein LOC103897123, partial [Aptenodytes forsteri]|uniref:uncharacterized protein LOC103897123 n=1 Tax=Aptenodytes forsteri TaxID=9233 RepID=UPI0004F404F8
GDAAEVVALTREVAQGAELDEELLRELAFQATGDLAPVNAFIGGLAAQEVMKAVSGKFTPITQWLYFDALECLPEENKETVLTEEQCRPRNSRYDGQIAVFGAELQAKLGAQKYFVVSVPTRPRVSPSVPAALPNVLPSPLRVPEPPWPPRAASPSVPSLFPSVPACQSSVPRCLCGSPERPRVSPRLCQMSSPLLCVSPSLRGHLALRPRASPPSSQASPRVNRVSPGVFVGLLSVPACPRGSAKCPPLSSACPRASVATSRCVPERPLPLPKRPRVSIECPQVSLRRGYSAIGLYMDRRCVYYRKPLLESGTLGTKGNVQVVIPFLSESYSSRQDPPEKAIPICTLKNFPNAIEHTLQ